MQSYIDTDYFLVMTEMSSCVFDGALKTKGLSKYLSGSLHDNRQCPSMREANSGSMQKTNQIRSERHETASLLLSQLFG